MKSLVRRLAPFSLYLRASKLKKSAKTIASSLLSPKKKKSLDFFNNFYSFFIREKTRGKLLPTIPGRSPLVIMITVSDLRIDPRVKKAAQYLAKANYRIVVMAPDIMNPPYNNDLDWGKNIRFDITHRESSAFMSEGDGLYAFDLFNAAATYNPFAYHCHDLPASVAGLAASRLRQCHLIVDFHEWLSEGLVYSEKLGSWVPVPTQRKQLLKLAELQCILSASATITVCDSIAQELSEMSLNSKISVIRNIPDPTHKYLSTTRYNLRTLEGIHPDSVIGLYQGGISSTRYLEPVVESLLHYPRLSLVFRGPMDKTYAQLLKSLADSLGVGSRLFILDPVPADDVISACDGADFGIYTVKPNTCKSFDLALPNKLFEYLYADLPVASGDFIEAKNIINKYSVGTTFDPLDPNDIAKSFQQLIANKSTIDYSENINRCLVDINADKEWYALANIYKNLE